MRAELLIDPSASIHPSAIIDLPASIGAQTKIWHFCHVMAGARIGAGCQLGQNIYVAASATIGDRCRIQNNVSLYDGVELEDDVFVGPSCVFTNVRYPRAPIDRKAEFLATRVSRGATLGANATIMAGVSIGQWAFVGAGAVVLADVAAHALVVGNPAQAVGWMSRTGEPLQFNRGRAQCPRTGEEYVLTAAGVHAVEGLVSRD